MPFSGRRKTGLYRSRNPENTPQIWGHRGFPAEYPENTLLSFAEALRLGIDGVELDIHRSRDGHIVVHHDLELDRTSNGSGFINHYTLSELKKLDAGGWFGKQFSGLQIPTLSEVFALVSQYPKVTVNIEVKWRFKHLPYPNLALDAWRMACQWGLQDRILVSSFNPFTLLDLKLHAPAVPIALLYSRPLTAPWRFARYFGISAIHPKFDLVDEGLVAYCRRSGLKVRPFTVNDERTARKMMHWGVDAIITDNPRKLLSLRKNA